MFCCQVIKVLFQLFSSKEKLYKDISKYNNSFGPKKHVINNYLSQEKPQDNIEDNIGLKFHTIKCFCKMYTYT